MNTWPHLVCLKKRRKYYGYFCNSQSSAWRWFVHSLYLLFEMLTFFGLHYFWRFVLLNYLLLLWTFLVLVGLHNSKFLQLYCSYFCLVITVGNRCSFLIMFFASYKWLDLSVVFLRLFSNVTAGIQKRSILINSSQEEVVLWRWSEYLHWVDVLNKLFQLLCFFLGFAHCLCVKKKPMPLLHISLKNIR